MYAEERGILFVTFIVVLVLILVDFMAPRWECESKWAVYGKTSYTLMGGCKVERNGKMVPVQTIREM